jgi:hypothetical protein
MKLPFEDGLWSLWFMMVYATHKNGDDWGMVYYWLSQIVQIRQDGIFQRL